LECGTFETVGGPGLPVATGRGTPAPPHSAACHIQDSRSHILAHTRQSRPHSGIDKTVTARLWHVQDSHGQIMARARQSRPHSGIDKTVTARVWHVQDRHGQILANTRQRAAASRGERVTRGSRLLVANAGLDLRTSSSQKCAAVPRRARISGS